jgi:hypothetical protein
VIRGGITLLAIVTVITGCGTSGRHASEASQSHYTLRQIKSAFVAQGFALQSLTRHPGLVVLADLQRAGAFGYQLTADKQHSGTEFLVYVGNGRDSAHQGNVWVGYSDGEAQSVKRALHRLAGSGTR